MVSTRGTKRRRAVSADSDSLSETIAVSVPEGSSTARPLSKRAATSSVGFGQTLADVGNSDDDFEEGITLGDLDEEDEELSEQAIHEARLAGDLVIDDEDEEDEEGDEEEGLEDVLPEEDETSTEFLQVDPVVVDQANVERFLTSLRDMIIALIGLVKALDSNSFFGAARSVGEAAGLLPVTRVWWQFLIKVDPDYLMELYSGAIPIEVQSVLGQVAFNVNDLLRLVGNGRDPSWGVYLNILTKNGQSALEWFRLYVGSALGKNGLWGRIKTYFYWVKTRDSGRSTAYYRKSGGAHAAAVLEPGTQIQFVKLAKFPKDTPKVYIYLLETLMMIFLQTFKSRGRSEFSPLMAVQWAIQLIPTGLSIIANFVGLNRAWTLSQGTGTRSTKGRICAICNIAHGVETWYHLDPSRPYAAMICHACYTWQIRNPEKPREIERSRKQRRARAYGKAKRAANDWNCDGCHRPLVGYDQRYFDESDGSQVFLCQPCTTIRRARDAPIEPKLMVFKASANTNANINANANAITSVGHCVGCGSDTKRTRIVSTGDVEIDGKYRCTGCIGGLRATLKSFRNKKPGKAYKYSTEGQILAFFSRNEAAPVHRTPKKALTKAQVVQQAHEHHCVACGSNTRGTTSCDGFDGKFRCSDCKVGLRKRITVFRNKKTGRKYKYSTEAEILDFYSRNEAAPVGSTS
ncbi:MAG: hypothetical protein Q9208_006319 [Pyrenodesmia sp. 3 TL-2023]